jgi:hypothetical protein
VKGREPTASATAEENLGVPKRRRSAATKSRVRRQATPRAEPVAREPEWVQPERSSKREADTAMGTNNAPIFE